jgi:HSP20 family protein
MPSFFDGWPGNTDIMQSEMSRLLDYIASSKPPTVRFSPSIWQPAIDIYETAVEFIITVDLAGVQENDIEILVDQKSFTIRGERKKAQKTDRRGRYYQMEIASGPFEKSVSLPAIVDHTRVTAFYENGIVEVTMPKVKARQNINIKIEMDNQRK